MRRRAYLLVSLAGFGVAAGGVFLAAQISTVEAWQTNSPSGMSDPVSLKAGQSYQLTASDGCHAFESYGVSVDVVNASTGEVAYSASSTVRRQGAQGHCTINAQFPILSVPRDGQYQVQWRIPQQLADYGLSFRLEITPLPSIALAAMFIGGLFAVITGLILYREAGRAGRGKAGALPSAGAEGPADPLGGPSPSEGAAVSDGAQVEELATADQAPLDRDPPPVPPAS